MNFCIIAHKANYLAFVASLSFDGATTHQKKATIVITFVDDTAGINPLEMRALTQRLVREQGEVSLIMIDYLQLMQIPGSSGDNGTNETCR